MHSFRYKRNAYVQKKRSTQSKSGKEQIVCEDRSDEKQQVSDSVWNWDPKEEKKGCPKNIL